MSLPRSCSSGRCRSKTRCAPASWRAARAMREEIEPDRAIAAALSAAGLALAADGGAVLRTDPSGTLTAAAQWGRPADATLIEDARTIIAAVRQVDIARDQLFLIGGATRFGAEV